MAQTGYPWALDLHVLYDLSADGLVVTQTATNLSPEPAPYASGAHPYLAVGDMIEDLELRVPARTRVLVDDRKLPVGTEPASAAYDFTSARRVGDVVLDDGFGDLVRDEGRCTVTLTDPASRRVIAESGVPVILMHMKGDPRTMQKNPVYDDVVADVCADLARARDAAVADGVPPHKIWLDPGIGFGKTLEHNLALLDATPRLKGLGHPVLVGASRKSFIGRIDRDGPADQRVGGSVAAALSAAARGADAVRVHDLAETRQALAVWSAIEGTPAG
jgi:hypothetical protein